MEGLTMKGIYSALLVSFDKEGNINEKGLRQIIRHNIDKNKVERRFTFKDIKKASSQAAKPTARRSVAPIMSDLLNSFILFFLYLYSLPYCLLQRAAPTLFL